MCELKIVATVIAKSECVNEVLKSLEVVTDATRKEEGNISYVLHKDVSNPSKFIILEEWKSQAAIDFHNQTAHFQNLKKELDGRIESLVADVIQEIY